MGDVASKPFLPLLKDTSRSFYIGIQTLQEPTQDKVCLAYLFCRILDVFEDATSVSVETRSALINDLKEYLEALPLAEDKRLLAVKSYAEKLKKSQAELQSHFNIHKNELELVKNSEAILWEIGKFDLMTRKIFRSTLLDMATGMKEGIQNSSAELTSVYDKDKLDSYCYTVAGTVGLFLSHVFWDEEAFQLGSTLDALEKQGIAFGKALQIVNITKDFHGDWAEKRLYWPVELSGKSVDWAQRPSIEDLKKALQILNELFESYAKKADLYVKQISDSRSDLVFFCKFPLEMARENMRIANKDIRWLADGSTPKVPRLWTMQLAQKLGISSDIMNFFN